MSLWMIGSLSMTLIGWAGWAAVALRPEIFPERTPIHWNAAGEIDGWSTNTGAAMSLIFVPIVLTVIVALGAALNRFAPGIRDDGDTRRRVDFTLFLTTAFFLTIGGLLIMAMRSGEFPIRLVMALLFVFFGSIGFAMRGLKQNRWIGVRTPWTLRDEAVWTRTHDFTAWFWPTLAGVGLLLVAADVTPFAYLALILPFGLVPIAASYFYSRQNLGLR